MNLDAYLGRIGYSGPLRPRVDVLRDLHRLHTHTIPYENVDHFLNRSIRLDTDSLQEKMVEKKRGGNCLEHNCLFFAVLDAMGFQVRRLKGPAIWNQAEDVPDALDHVLLCVDIEGQTLVSDVGFGTMTMTVPLQLEGEAAQQTPHEPMRLLKRTEGYLLQVQLLGDWINMIRFGVTGLSHDDYEAINRRSEADPAYQYKHKLAVGRIVPGARYSLQGARFTVRDCAGGASDLEMSKLVVLKSTLELAFGLALEPGDLHAVWDKLQNSLAKSAAGGPK